MKPIHYRLWSLTLVMLSSAVAVHYWPGRNWWIVPAVLGVGFRLTRLWFEARRRNARQ